MTLPLFLQKRIHDWSKTLPDWQRDLLRRLASGALSDADRSEIRAMLTGAPGAPAPVPLELADLPADQAEHGRVELRSLGNFRNINCLAENQTLRLRPGLNVVFGGNGTGKTGHSRLLRGVCRAAEREDVLPNVFSPTRANTPQTAELTITVDDVEKPVSVDLAKTPERVLSSISVFDAPCARVFLTKANTVDYVPRPLILLKALAEAQAEIADQLAAEVAASRCALPSLPEVGADTKVGLALEALTRGADLRELEELARLSEEELAQLDELEKAAAATRADKGKELEASARTRAGRAQAASVSLREAADAVDAPALEEIARVRAELDAARRAETELADQAFSGQHFPGAGQDAWREMWLAAKRYVESGGSEFPSDETDTACPLCEQKLSDQAAARFAALEDFVRGDLRGRVKELTKQLEQLLESLPDLPALTTIIESELRDLPKTVLDAGRAAVATIEAGTRRANDIGAGRGGLDDRSPISVDTAALEAFSAEQMQAAQTQASFRDEAKRAENLSKLGELDARRTLQVALPSVRDYWASRSKTHLLEAAQARLGTQAISLQLRKLQEATVTDRLRAAIAEELKGLTRLGDQVELIGKASRGETLVQLRLRDGCNEKVDRVLSTGEQGSVATAFFLAEVAVSEGRSAIVLDDPVSSLDHDNREYLANRLVEESTRRQVVIYTHDLTFLIHLQEAAEARDIEVHGQTLMRSVEEAGIVREELPTKIMSPSNRRKALHHQLRFSLTPLFEGGKPEYEQLADVWVGDLRKGYDQVIEEYVLAGTVRRFHRHVRIKQLFQVSWSLEIAERIEKAMKAASPKTHYEAPELYPRPFTPQELAEMLDEFDAICEVTKPVKRSERDRAGVDETLVEQLKAAGSQTP